jgi:Phosphate-selective porin
MKLAYTTLLVFGTVLALTAQGEMSASVAEKLASPPPVPVSHGEKRWFESISLRGYAQVRYNRFLETNSSLACEQCDRSIGENGGIFLRRMRLIFFGQISKRAYVYVQPDFASSASSSGLHFGQLRDAYFDLGLDKNNEFRLRIGQSKVPYGFENMQSSQNRLPLDRADALNSAVSNERDMGVFFTGRPKIPANCSPLWSEMA